MARPTKDGLDYFPLDCQMDSKVRRLEAEHGNNGFAVYIKLLQEAFKQQAGEVDISDPSTRKILSKDANISEKKWRKIVETCASLGLFSESSFKNLVVTSNGIKKRIQKVADERERAKQRADAKRKAIEEHKARGSSGGYSPNNPPSNSGETGEKEKEKEKGNTEREILKDGKGNFESNPQSRDKKAPPIPDPNDLSQFSQQDWTVRVLGLFRSTQVSNMATGMQESTLFGWWKKHGTDRMLWAIEEYGKRYDRSNIHQIESLLTSGGFVTATELLKNNKQGGLSTSQTKILTPGYYD